MFTTSSLSSRPIKKTIGFPTSTGLIYTPAKYKWNISKKKQDKQNNQARFLEVIKLNYFVHKKSPNGGTAAVIEV